jgi:hypothetical protein
MFWIKDKEQERLYLLPCQGGSAARRKQRYWLLWSIVAGLLVSAALAAVLYFINDHPWE